ncbi:PREDICTED: palladin isoform X4 [Aptenodytes forsteri]|uniref:palladin isoform X4 n=2 Tax=Aptenodytes TaxID=9232 RepID=UPI0004F44135|nr:PREDICTED: palladin isoform X4 [Aptenodytes forsteri]
MQDRSCGQALPLSLMLKEAYCAERGTNRGYPENMSEASSYHDFFYDSLSDIQNGEFSNELSAFLTQEEICKSLDIAREAIANSMKEDQNAAPDLTHYFNTSLSSTSENPSFRDTKLHEQDALRGPQASSLTSSAASHILPGNQKEQSTAPQTASSFVTVSRKQASPSHLLTASPSFIRSLKHLEKDGPGVPKTSPNPESASQGEVPFRNKLCDKAATFIEELSSIFRQAAKTRGRSPDGDSSSPDSGYLSPKKKQPAASTSVNQEPDKPHQETEPEAKLSGIDLNGEHFSERESITQSEMVLCHPFINMEENQSSPPQFTQKLRSQEVAEGNKVLLECRVAGNPVPDVRWFCEGKELQNTPDIQIRSGSGGLHSLIIAEAFEDDTGRYTCVASNSIGSDSTSAEIFIEGASSTDSESESLIFKSKSGAMPQAQKKTTSVSLTIGSSTPKSGVTTAVIQPISVPSQQVQSPTSYLHRVDGPKPIYSAPIFTKELQNSTASEGQVVVLECRVRGPPPIHVKWFRQGVEIQDSPDFRILQKKPRSATEPEEICTLVIAETFPEDSGLFTCTATNEHGSVTSSAQLTVCSANSESSSHESLTRESNSDDFHHFPPLPSVEISSLELASKKHTETHQANDTELRSGVTALQLQLNSAEEKTNGIHPIHGVNGMINSKPNGDKSIPPPAVLLSPTKEPPPVLAKPKLGFPKKTGRTARIASDEEIQGSKDAVIQDLERKLRFKEDLLNNGQPRLTYEEKMARRLLGADSAATVFNIQEPEEEPAIQEARSVGASVVSPVDIQKEYKVSSFEQRLISEIEYRLERSPVEESDDEVQHGDESIGNSMSPYFEIKLKHYKIFEGMPVTFTCKVAGNPKPKIYWFKDGKQISKRSDHYRIQREPDGTCSLHTAASTLDDDGNYTIMAANPQGRISCTGRLMVQAVNQRGRSPWSPSGQPHMRRPRSRSRDSGDENEPIQERFFRPHFLQAPGDLTVQEGKLCRMDCKVSGLPTPDLSWQLNGRPIRPDSSHKMLVRENGVHSLIIEPVTARDAGIYTCIASNRAGENTFSLELIVAAKEVHKAPVFIEKLQNTGVTEGFPVRLECRISGEPSPQIFWKKENESLTYNTDRVSMHQDNYGYICLLIQGATKEDAGWYTVSAKNEAGIVSCTARLDVYTQWQQPPQTTKPKKVRPSASRYAALCDQGLDIRAAFQPEANPVHLTMQSGLVESDDL